jgi:hypothetical protein
MPRGAAYRRARKRLFGKEITKSFGRQRVASGMIDDIFGVGLTRVAIRDFVTNRSSSGA